LNLPTENDEPESEWLNTTTEYEGRPLELRVRPSAETADARLRFQFLAAVTHDLARVRPDGLPETDYNDGLGELDAAVIESFERAGNGLIAIIETFSGQRTYYAYVASDAVAHEAMDAIQQRFFKERLSLAVKRDPSWALFAEYKRLFAW
jgi:hypothetical protein